MLVRAAISAIVVSDLGNFIVVVVVTIVVGGGLSLVA